MKKILLPSIFCAFAFFYSCSSDSDTVTDKNTQVNTESSANSHRLNNTDLDTARQLYADMTKTTEYTDYKASLRAFNEKLHPNNISYVEKSDWMDWIRVNISATTFNSVQEFESMFDDSVNKLTILMDSNRTVYDFLLNADVDQINIITKPERGFIPNPPVTTNGCIEDCMDTADAAFDSAQADHDAAIEAAGSMINPAMALGVILGADRKLDDRNLEIAMEYNGCAGNC